MDPTNVIIILLAAVLLALIAHRFVLARFSDPVQAELERSERERARAARQRPRANSASAALGRALPLSKDAADETRAKLVRAGMKTDPSTWHGTELLCLAALTLAGFAIGTTAGGPGAVVMTAVGAALGAVAPRYYVARRTRKRRERIEADLPDALDLMAVAVRAGASVDRALRLVSEKTDGPVSEEFAQCVRDVNMLSFRSSEALTRMAGRTGSRQLSMFCSALSQSIEQGAAVAPVLLDQAAVARRAQFDFLEARANTIPTKVVLPMALSFVPATILTGVAPQIASLVGFLGQLGA